MEQLSFEEKVADALIALTMALCKQPSINAQQLRGHFLDALEFLAQSPADVGNVGKSIAQIMDALLRGGGRIPPSGV